MYQLQIRELAKEDIQNIVDYYDIKTSTLVVDKFLESLYHELDFLKNNPDSSQIKYKNTRVRYLKNFSFGIHYRIIEKNIIEVLAVLHTSRNPKLWKNG